MMRQRPGKAVSSDLYQDGEDTSKMPRKRRALMSWMLEAIVITIISAVVLLLVYRYLFSEPHGHSKLRSATMKHVPWGEEFDICEKRPYCLHMQWLQSNLRPLKYNVLLIHGTSHHGAWYNDFAVAMTDTDHVNVFALDLKGHGKTGPEPGVFTMAEWMQDIEVAAQHIKAKYPKAPLVAVGSSQGGEVAWVALNEVKEIDYAVSMNILLAEKLNVRFGAWLLKSPLFGGIVEYFAGGWKLPLDYVVDFPEAFDHDRSRKGELAYHERLRDPLMVWEYTFASYRSIFTYQPKVSAPDNKKPILIACGEKDTIIPASFCKQAYDVIGGPKNLYVMPDGSHQMMVFQTHAFARMVSSWMRHHLDHKQNHEWEQDGVLPSVM